MANYERARSEVCDCSHCLTQFGEVRKEIAAANSEAAVVKALIAERKETGEKLGARIGELERTVARLGETRAVLMAIAAIGLLVIGAWARNFFGG